MTFVSRFLEKDLKVTPDPDGTYTILVLATGNDVIYDDAGRVLARSPGQTRYEILVAADGEFLEFLGVVKGSTGRNDSFDCADFIAATA